MHFTELLRSPEFAHQLNLLSEEKMLIDEDSRKVSNWLVAALTDDNTETASIGTFPVITKKVRDECVQIDGGQFFRRSALYTVVKAILHHNLTLNCGSSIGRLAYKMLMLRFVAPMCRPFVDALAEAINVDLMAQMIAKIARRVEKLRDLYAATVKCHEKVANYEEICGQVLDEAKKMIADVRAKIDISSLEAKWAKEAELMPLNGLSFDKDANQRVKTLTQFISSA